MSAAVLVVAGIIFVAGLGLVKLGRSSLGWLLAGVLIGRGWRR